MLLESDKPGIVVAQLETTDGKVLGSTKFLYKEEISTGFQKIVCSKNYGGKLIMGLSDFGAKEDQAMANESEANQGKDLLYPIGDQSDISPYNINTKSSRQVMRIEKNINKWVIDQSQFQILRTNIIEIVQQENYGRDLGS